MDTMIQQNLKKKDTDTESTHVQNHQTKWTAQTKQNWSILVGFLISFGLLDFETLKKSVLGSFSIERIHTPHMSRVQTMT